MCGHFFTGVGRSSGLTRLCGTVGILAIKAMAILLNHGFDLVVVNDDQPPKNFARQDPERGSLQSGQIMVTSHKHIV